MSWAMAMNSPPSSRYRTASDAMTPISDRALEIGCFCTTRLMAQITAITAKTRKRIASIKLRERHDQAGYEQVGHRDREHERPGETHQLIVSEARERTADPYIKEENDADFGGEP